MTSHKENKGPEIRTGILLALLAVIIWSGNFIVARDVIKQIPPVSLNFYRWLTATIIIAPFAWKQTRNNWSVIKNHLLYFFWVALTGVSLFNTFVYVGAHYTTAINMALIGTTSSPIMVVILARIFIKEKIYLLKAIGTLLCLTGVLFLLSQGDFHNLVHLHFGEGDLWLLVAAFCFAIYNILVRKKPKELRPLPFLFVIFSLGTIIMIPFFFYEAGRSAAIPWNAHLIGSVIFLGLGASVICFFIWNIAIGKLGAGRTALFGNLIPVFSSLEAVAILHERITTFHLVSFSLVVIGLVIANFSYKQSA
jgi:drug/metabolite transporter (DMT)-like permease